MDTTAQSLQSSDAEPVPLREVLAATREILALVAQVRADVQPVLDRIADAAVRLCGASQANVAMLDGGLVHLVAQSRVDAVGDEPDTRDAVRRLLPRPPGPGLSITRAVLTGRPVVIPDVHADPDYAPEVAAVTRAFSAMGVPLLRDGVPIGAIAVGRSARGPFPEDVVALLETFAEQAVLAIESARRFQELEARHRELREALDQQTATSEILRVISRSPTDLVPVFAAVAASVARLVDAPDVVILKVVDGRLRHAASVGTFGATIGAELDLPLDRSNVCGVALTDRTMVHVEDLAAVTDPAMNTARAIQQRYGQRTMVAAPMLHGDVPLGTIAVLRPEVRPFTPRQLALLQSFADQAVIAIQNARLFDALQARTAELEEKSRQLEVASRHKSAFLANMSHELRTPLNAIIGFTRIVRRTSAERLEPLQRDNLEKILASANHLLTLINAVLDLAKVESGRIEIDARPVALAALLDECLRTVEPLVKADVELVSAFEPGLPTLVTDADKLRQVVVNLLGNAAKFTPEGRIELGARVRDDVVEIAVADTGIGIAADALERIFDEFEQADAGPARAHGGTGLGLAIARRLARTMGGDVTVRSHPGAGSTFTLTLPRGSSAPPPWPRS